MAPKRPRTFHLGEWLARLGRKPVELAKAVGVGESYISLLISGQKDNPSIRLLLDISEFLGLTINDLYRRPPPREASNALGHLSPAQLATLGTLLDEMKNRGPKKPD
jgi:transcriptional regulator with XRE-family HTH domain